MAQFDQVEAAHRYGSSIITGNIVLLVATTLSVALRLVAKMTTKAKFGLDDVFLVVGQLFWYANAGLGIYCKITTIIRRMRLYN